MIFHTTFDPVPRSLIFRVTLLQLFPLVHPQHVAQAPHPLTAAVRGHQDLHFISLEHVSH